MTLNLWCQIKHHRANASVQGCTEYIYKGRLNVKPHAYTISKLNDHENVAREHIHECTDHKHNYHNSRY